MSVSTLQQTISKPGLSMDDARAVFYAIEAQALPGYLYSAYDQTAGEFYIYGDDSTWSPMNNPIVVALVDAYVSTDKIVMTLRNTGDIEPGDTVYLDFTHPTDIGPLDFTINGATETVDLTGTATEFALMPLTTGNFDVLITDPPTLYVSFDSLTVEVRTQPTYTTVIGSSLVPHYEIILPSDRAIPSNDSPTWKEVHPTLMLLEFDSVVPARYDIMFQVTTSWASGEEVQVGFTFNVDGIVQAEEYTFGLASHRLTAELDTQDSAVRLSIELPAGSHSIIPLVKTTGGNIMIDGRQTRVALSVNVKEN